MILDICASGYLTTIGLDSGFTLDKMATISRATAFSSAIVFYLDSISQTIFPNGLIDNKAALVQVMAWRRKGHKPLPELMMTQFTDAYKRHQGEIGWIDPQRHISMKCSDLFNET